MKTSEMNGVTVELVVGDITRQPDCEAVVNAANAQLMIGGGVAGAIHRAAGPDLYEECKPLAPIRPGEAVITGGHALPNTYVIHCLGPVYGVDTPSDKLLADCYRNAIRLAEENRVERIAFCALSTGAFGYPMKEAAEIALRTVREALADASHIKLVRFVLFDDRALTVYETALGAGY